MTSTVIGGLPPRANLNAGGALFTSPAGPRMLLLPDGGKPAGTLVDPETMTRVAATAPAPGENRKEGAALTWAGGALLFSVSGDTYVADASTVRVLPRVAGAPHGQQATGSLTVTAPGALASGWAADFQGTIARFDVPATGTTGLWTAMGKPFGGESIRAICSCGGMVLVGFFSADAARSGVYAISESTLDMKLRAGTLTEADFTRVPVDTPNRIINMSTYTRAGGGEAIAVQVSDTVTHTYDPSARSLVARTVYGQVMAPAPGGGLMARWNHWGTYYLSAIPEGWKPGDPAPSFIAHLGDGQIERGIPSHTVNGKPTVASFHPFGASLSEVSAPVSPDKADALPRARPVRDGLVDAPATLVGEVAQVPAAGGRTHVICGPLWINDPRVGVSTLGPDGTVEGQQVWDQNATARVSRESVQVEHIQALEDGTVLLGCYPAAGIIRMDPATGATSERLTVTAVSTLRSVSGTGAADQSRPVCGTTMPGGRAALGITGRYNGTGGGSVVVVEAAGPLDPKVAPVVDYYGADWLGVSGHNIVSMTSVVHRGAPHLLLGTSTGLEVPSMGEPAEDAALVLVPILAGGKLGAPVRRPVPRGVKTVWSIRPTKAGRLFAQMQFWSRRVPRGGVLTRDMHTLVELAPDTCIPLGRGNLIAGHMTGRGLYPTVTGASRSRGGGQIVETPTGSLIVRTNVQLWEASPNGIAPYAGGLIASRIEGHGGRLIHANYAGEVWARQM